MVLFLVSVVLWIILSGYFSFLPMFPGLVFLALGIFLFKKIKKDSNSQRTFSVKPNKFVFYILYMIKEIYFSNIFVAKIILKNKPDPIVFTIPNDFKTHTCTTVFANSVTLTPGTIILHASEKEFIIHSLTPDLRDGVLDYGMYNKVLDLEKYKEEGINK